MTGSDVASETKTPIDRLNHPAFLGFLATQFFGAFNDNLFKQLLLLLAIPTAVAVAGEAGESAEKGVDLQGVATMVFGIPFVVFGGLAGFVADRFGKRSIIVTSKTAEVVVMCLGLVAFLCTPVIGFWGLWIVLFLMGLQSTFFGPGKYGIMPEMLPPNELGRANGVVLMTTFIAIIIGTAVAGPLKDSIVPPDMPQMQAASGLWIGSLVCIGLAVVGVLTSLLIVRVPAADPTLKLQPESFGIPKVIRRLLLKEDRPLLFAIFASCVFWMIAGLTIQSVNSLGKVQLGLTDTWTSILVSLISLGIAIGGAVAGQLSRKYSGNTVIQIGMWSTIVFCTLLSITIPGWGHLLGFYGCIPGLILLGAAAAFFAIPIQVFLQARPPEELKGRMIAVMNQANFFALVVSGIVYQVLNGVIDMAGWPRSVLFAAMAIFFLPVAIFYKLEPRVEEKEMTSHE